MSVTDVFGELINLAVGPSRAVEGHLKKWVDTYMSAYEEYNGTTPYYYVRPQSWIKTNLLSTLPGEDLSPAVITIVRGAVGGPQRQSGGYDIPLGVGVAVVTSSFEGDGARESAGAIGAAVLGIMSHKRNLGGRMNGRLRVQSWSDFRLDDLPGEEAQTRGLLRMEFVINVTNVTNLLTNGPDEPDPPYDEDNPPVYVPPGSLPTVATHNVNVIKEDPQ